MPQVIEPEVRAIWEPFLTHRDRRHRDIAGEPPAAGLGKRPALLLIDNYRLVLREDTRPLLDGLADNPLFVGAESAPAITAQQSLLEAARTRGVPVVHVTGYNGLPGQGYARAHADLRGRPAEWAYPDPHDFDLIDGLAPRDGEFVITKAAPSAFFGTPLVALLHMLDVDTLVVSGEATSGCVRATVVDAASYRFRVAVPADAVYDRHEASHAIGLFDMAQKYADVLTTARLLDQLGMLRPAP